MKIKYRRFDDTDYTEVECDNFVFKNTDYKTLVLCLAFRNKYYEQKDINKVVLHDCYKFKGIENVCEVYIEEI